MKELEAKQEQARKEADEAKERLKIAQEKKAAEKGTY
jgi:hypothetical protein